MFASTDCAASPATIEAIPADARTLAPNVWIAGKVSSAAPIAMMTMITTATRRRISTWVRMRRAMRLSGTSIR